MDCLRPLLRVLQGKWNMHLREVFCGRGGHPVAEGRDAYDPYRRTVRGICQESPGFQWCYIVPAFAGMGAPYWNPYARGTIVGLTRGCKKEHFIRATLESIAYQAKDVIHAMEEDAGVTLNGLRVDGGASANNMLVQFQADIIDAAVLRPECIETTALGAAYLAGLAAGYWKDRDEIRENWQLGRRFEPVMDSGERKKLLRGWQRAVRCARLWAEDGE